MKKAAVLIGLAVLFGAAAAHAEDLVCKGTITSIQGEGLVARTYHFDVPMVAGADVSEVLERVKKLAADKQNKASRSNPSLRFRRNSDVSLECEQGGQKLELRRTVRVVY